MENYHGYADVLCLPMTTIIKIALENRGRLQCRLTRRYKEGCKMRCSDFKEGILIYIHTHDFDLLKSIRTTIQSLFKDRKSVV